MAAGELDPSSGDSSTPLLPALPALRDLLVLAVGQKSLNPLAPTALPSLKQKTNSVRELGINEKP